MRNLIFSLLLLFSGSALAAPCSTSGSGSFLSRAAQGLSAGQWCDFDAGETSGLSDINISGATGDKDYVSWQHGAQWDSISGVLIFVGWDYAPYSQATVVYKESQNDWDVLVGSPFSVSTEGHVYDQNAIDPATGELYYRPRLSTGTYRGKWNGSTVSWTGNAIASIANGCTSAITSEEAIGWTWDASRNGLVLFTDAGAGPGKEGRSCFWAKGSSSWSVDGDVDGNVGPYHHVAEYDPVSEIVWMQGNFSNDHWKNDKGVVTKQSSTPPFSLGCCGSSGAESTPDPVSGKFIVTKYSGSRQWYQYDVVTDQWSSISHSMPPITGSTHGNVTVIGASLPDHGVILYIDANGLGSQNLYLYKHNTGPNPPGVIFTADDSSVASGGNTDLNWSATNATSCTASGDWSGSKATSGTENTGAIVSDETYVLTCTGPGGQTVRQVTVTVVGLPTVSLTAFPLDTTVGGSSTLTWSSTDATSCTASTGWSGTKATSGSELITNITTATTFDLDCTGPGGVGNDSVTVTVGGSGGDTLLSEDFEGYADAQDPTDWTDTAANNSMSTADGFETQDLGSNIAFYTPATSGANIHSHYTGTGASSWADYEYTGRMMMTGSGDGIGVTVLSNYTTSDAYYRLRAYGGGAFNIAPHGTNCIGDTALGISPSASIWYRFKVRVEDTGSLTNVKAKVWQDGSGEPASWQADCNDSSGSRRTVGTIGVWAVANTDTGSKHWDDLAVTTLAGAPPAALVANPKSLKTAYLDVAYSDSVTASNGTPPYTWSVVSGAVPVGLTVETDGDIVGTPTLAGSTQFTLRVTDDASNTDDEIYSIDVQDPGASNWAARSTAPGVVLANRFDNESTDFCNNLWPAAVGTRGDGTCHNERESYYDTDVKASGNASVRFEYNNCPTGGACGEGWAGEIAMFIPDYNQQFAGDNTNYEEFWVQWRQRWDSNVIDTQYSTSAGNGQSKLFIVSQGLLPGQTDKYKTRSCSENQTVVSNLAWGQGGTAHARYPSSFHGCGFYANMETGSTPSTTQNFGDSNPNTYTCKRWPPEDRPLYPAANTCKWFLPNQWMTFMVHVVLGPDGTSNSSLGGGAQNGFINSTYELYVAYEGEPLELVHRQTGVVFRRGNDADDTNDEYSSTSHIARFGAFRWLPHLTAKTGETLTASEIGSTWIDELIVSTDIIADPSGAAPPPDITPPVAPTNITLTPE